ncbi:MAG: hypothetical protein NTZ16_07575 [Verrucomicrobia bacterium]|nr:hypothetical protein [Verrucomicrobiota bacterium]
MNRALSVIAGLLLFNPVFLTTGGVQAAARNPNVQFADDETQRLPETDSSNDALNRLRLPNTQIERDSGPPYGSMYYDVGVGQRLEPRVGGFSATLPDIFQTGFRYNAPFLSSRGSTTNAEIKLGRFYYDVTSLSTSWLFSDNVNRAETGVSSGFIGICTLKGVAMLQLLENLRFAATAELVLLPLRGKFGLAGFVRDSGEARLFLSDSYGRERLRAQIAYDLLVGGWNARIYDQVQLKSPAIGLDERFNIAAGEPFDEQDRAGRYAFRSSGGGSGLRVNEYDRRNDLSFNYVNNQMGVSANRLLPTETRATFGAYRMNYWYLGDSGAIMPRTRDVGYASLNSERDNLRFKPFVAYQIYRSNEQEWKFGLPPVFEQLWLLHRWAQEPGCLSGSRQAATRYQPAYPPEHRISPRHHRARRRPGRIVYLSPAASARTISERIPVFQLRHI